MPIYRRRRMVRRPRRKMMRRPYRINRSARNHAPKSFCSTFKLLDVNADPYGTHTDGYARNALSVTLGDIPIFSNLYTLYSQFAITSVKLSYRPKVNIAAAGAAPTASIAELLFAEDKSNYAALSALQVRSQDNCRTLVASRNWGTFIKKPRPLLFQTNYDDQQVQVITKAKDIHWLSPNSVGAPETTIKHLFGQLCVSDVTGTAETIGCGELWCKVYLAVKEQRKTAAV